MSQAAEFAQWVLFGSLLLAYGAAVRDAWLTFDRQPPHVHRAARRWGGAAILLVAFMGAVSFAALGQPGLRHFARGVGLVFGAQALLTLPVVLAGAEFMARNGRRLAGVRQWRRWPWRQFALALMLMTGWSVLLVTIVPFRVLPGPVRAMGLDRMPIELQVPFLIGLITLAPILEETLFRHYLLHRLTAAFGGRRAGVVAAVVATAALWALTHVGTVEPAWLKWLHVFPIGLLLGWVGWTRGLEPAIALHWAFNLVVAPLGALATRLLVENASP